MFSRANERGLGAGRAAAQGAAAMTADSCWSLLTHMFMAVFAALISYS